MFGNAERDTLRGPGWLSFDMSLQRSIDLVQRLNATLRWDIVNVFNRANLGLPDSNIVNPTAGAISNLAGDPRAMQLSIRLAFWAIRGLVPANCDVCAACYTPAAMMRATRWTAPALLALLLASGSTWAEAARPRFDTTGRAEAVATVTVTVTCDGCAWDIAGREAVVLSLVLDGRYVQHLPIVRTGRADYSVLLGRVEPGRPRSPLRTWWIDRDVAGTAPLLPGGAPFELLIP